MARPYTLPPSAAIFCRPRTSRCVFSVIFLTLMILHNVFRRNAKTYYCAGARDKWIENIVQHERHFRRKRT
jgi:hypothetical protein